MQCGANKRRTNPLAKLADTGHRGTEVRAMMREKCTEKEKPRNTAGNRTYEKGKRRLSDGTMNEKESRHSMPGNGHTKKGRDVDVRNGREMVTGLNRK